MQIFSSYRHAYADQFAGVSLNFDWTFKSALKAKVVDSATKKRIQTLLGGLLTFLNEDGLIVGYVRTALLRRRFHLFAFTHCHIFSVLLSIREELGASRVP